MHKQSRSYKKNDQNKEFYQGRQRTQKNRTPTENSGRLDKIDTKMIQLGLYVHEYKNRIKKLLL
jgi:hypothetical protein